MKKNNEAKKRQKSSFEEKFSSNFWFFFAPFLTHKLSHYDDYFSEDDDGLINENTSMSDMLLENEWDFEDDWNKGNDNDDDW